MQLLAHCIFKRLLHEKRPLLSLVALLKRTAWTEYGKVAVTGVSGQVWQWKYTSVTGAGALVAIIQTQQTKYTIASAAVAAL